MEKSVKRLKANDPSLTELYLSDHSTGNSDDEAKAIAEALKVNTVLTTLYLSNNSIGDEGSKAIAEALKDNTVLTTLHLVKNSIGDDGAKAIVEALKVNTFLTTLDLGDNQTGDDQAKAISEALRKNTDLTELSIDWSKMKEAMDNEKSRPIELTKKFIDSCTNSSDKAMKLGHGGFGVVYKYTDDDRCFVVKCMDVKQDKIEKGIKTFKRELQVSSFLVSSFGCCFMSLQFSFFSYIVPGIKNIPTPQYCIIVWLLFSP